MAGDPVPGGPVPGAPARGAPVPGAPAVPEHPRLATAPAPVRTRFRVTGTVQGVGFRPFVHRQAEALGLSGFVRNDAGGVEVEVEGDAATVERFARLLGTEAPPSARIGSLVAEPIVPLGEGRGFRIEASAPSPAAGPGATGSGCAVGADRVSCAACLAEVADPANRRFRYPFTTCTDCGPRYTVVRERPYDRARTTLAAFAPCAACRREYDDPADRRFHHETNVCPSCGPVLGWRTGRGPVTETGERALAAAVAALLGGQIVAVKGLGGYHLAVDATSARAVGELRRRKGRAAKPFAVMVRDLDDARRRCVLDAAAEAALASPAGPIVVVPRRAWDAMEEPEGGADGEPAIAAGVAPGLDEVGVLVPYTPLHRLLLDGVGRPLVLTSGNVADEPIVVDDDAALDRLGPLVDGFLTHDRPIQVRADDSVVRATGSGLQVLRRSRGEVPAGFPVPGLPAAARPHASVLAVGGHLKVTVALTSGDHVIASHHLGDLDHLDARLALVEAVAHLERLTGVAPTAIAHDLHPDYASTGFAADLAAERGVPTVGVQHHHAHLASCLVEHGRSDPVVALCFDGLGFGADGSLWGGEVLVGDLRGFRRVGHLRAVPMPGGVTAIREPWRMAAAWLATAVGREEAVCRLAPLDPRVETVVALTERGTAPRTTGAGRLFDAVAALVLGRTHQQYEAQGAIELERAARSVGRERAPTYPGSVPLERGPDGLVLDPGPLLGALLADLDAGVAVEEVAAGFHEALGRTAGRAATEAARAAGLGTVALTGGVFQNARLSEVVTATIQDEGLEVLAHRSIPPNDGGLAVGQAAVALTAAVTP